MIRIFKPAAPTRGRMRGIRSIEYDTVRNEYRIIRGLEPDPFSVDLGMKEIAELLALNLQSNRWVEEYQGDDLLTMVKFP